MVWQGTIVTNEKQAAWSRRNEQRRIEAGGRRLPGGVLPPDAARALSSLVDSGYAASVTGCISKALVEVDNRRRKAK